VSGQHLQVCGTPEPRTSTEGMFSVRYAAALALTGSGTGPDAFTDERVRDPALAAVRDRVRITPVAGVPNIDAPTEVRVRLASGDELRACVNSLTVKPDDELPRQWEALTAKFLDLVSPVLGAGRAGELVGLVRRVETLTSVRELTERTAAKQ
ncbi:MAG: MmgE/PrpD family protein, partial [Nocardiopsaceae bacterium]|nr:MmgE/PrpD family protein [Nocardiopsaceae bacterium]